MIVLFVEEEVNSDDETKESVLESFRTAWKEAKTGKMRPVSELWDGIEDSKFEIKKGIFA